MPEITVEQFFQTEMRVGRITRAENFAKAKKPAYKLWIDFGPYGIKQSSAQITKRYTPEQLLGRLVVAVTNFPPRQIVDFSSEVLVLGVEVGQGDVILLKPDSDDIPLGNAVS